MLAASASDATTLETEATGTDPDSTEKDTEWIGKVQSTASEVEEKVEEEVEEASFTETEISDAIQQLPAVWKKREDGYWETLEETDEEKRERAMAILAPNKRFEVSRFEFKFPRARTYEFIRARSRL